MPNFVIDNTSLPYPKTDLVDLQNGADPTKYVVALDWNTVAQALIDVKEFLRDSPWLSLSATPSDPTPASVSDYLWLRDDGVLLLKFGGSSTQVGGSSTVTPDFVSIQGDGSVGSPLALCQPLSFASQDGSAFSGIATLNIISGHVYKANPQAPGDGIGAITWFNSTPNDLATFWLLNVSDTQTITVKHEYVTYPTAARRIMCPNLADFTIRTRGGVQFIYNGDSSRWQIVAP